MNTNFLIAYLLDKLKISKPKVYAAVVVGVTTAGAFLTSYAENVGALATWAAPIVFIVGLINGAISARTTKILADAAEVVKQIESGSNDN